MMKFVDWVDQSKLNWDLLCENPNATDVLNANPDKIGQELFESLKKKPTKPSNKINYWTLSANPYAIELIKQNLDKISWYILSANPAAIEILRENPDKINWTQLSANPAGIELLKENPDKINWYKLAANPNAVEFLKENPDKIESFDLWYELSGNPNAIEFLKENPDKINWNGLSSNYNAMELLKENQDKIDWDSLSLNPSIFTYDYKKLYESNVEFKEEIIAKALHPKRIFRLIAEYGEDEIYDVYLSD